MQWPWAWRTDGHRHSQESSKTRQPGTRRRPEALLTPFIFRIRCTRWLRTCTRCLHPHPARVLLDRALAEAEEEFPAAALAVVEEAHFKRCGCCRAPTRVQATCLGRRDPPRAMRLLAE